MTTISPEDEDIARTLMHSAVADIHVGYSLVDRVEAGTRRRRRKRWPLLLLVPIGVLAGATASAGWYFAHHADGATHPAWPVTAVPESEIVCASPLPPNWTVDGIPPTADVPGADRLLVPGTPRIAVACSVDGTGGGAFGTSGIAGGTRLPPTEESAVLQTFRSGARNRNQVSTACSTEAAGYQPLYFVFEYGNGAQLTVLAEPVRCGGSDQITWLTTNGLEHAQIQSGELDSLGADGAQG